MKIIYSIISFISSILFLKEYRFNEEKLQKIKKRSLYLVVIWVLFILPFIFPMPNILKGFTDNEGFQFLILYFLIFSIYHWYFLIYTSQFTKRHIAHLILLSPLTIGLIWNLIMWNKPTYYGAMDGFAAIATFQVQLIMLLIFPTFLFALRMVEIKNLWKGILLILIVLTSAILGIKQCIGKEGYLSDSTGNVFIVLLIILLTISVFLIKTSGKINFNRIKP